MRPRVASSLRPARPQDTAEPGALQTSCSAHTPPLVPAASRRPATLQHRTLLARRPPLAHDGTDCGDPAPGVPTSMRARCTCPRLQGFLWTPASDRRAAARCVVEQAKRSAAPQPATAATRSPQPPQRPPPGHRRAGRPPPLAQKDRGRTTACVTTRRTRPAPASHQARSLRDSLEIQWWGQGASGSASPWGRTRRGCACPLWPAAGPLIISPARPRHALLRVGRSPASTGNPATQDTCTGRVGCGVAAVCAIVGERLPSCQERAVLQRGRPPTRGGDESLGLRT